MDDVEPLVDNSKKNEGSASMATEHGQENTCMEAQKTDSVEESDSQTELPKDDIHEEMESDGEKNQDSVPHSQVTESQRELQSLVEESDFGSPEFMRILNKSSSSENRFSEKGYEPDYDSTPQSQVSPRERGPFRVEEHVGECSRVAKFIRPFFCDSSSSDEESLSSEDGYGPDQMPFMREIERILWDEWSSALEKWFKEGKPEDYDRLCANHSSFTRRLRRGQIPLEYYLREPQGTSVEEQEESNENIWGFLENFTCFTESRRPGRRSQNEFDEIEMTDLSRPDIVAEHIEYFQGQVSSYSDSDEEWRYPRSNG